MHCARSSTRIRCGIGSPPPRRRRRPPRRQAQKRCSSGAPSNRKAGWNSRDLSAASSELWTSFVTRAGSCWIALPQLFLSIQRERINTVALDMNALNKRCSVESNSSRACQGPSSTTRDTSLLLMAGTVTTTLPTLRLTQQYQTTTSTLARCAFESVQPSSLQLPGLPPCGGGCFRPAMALPRDGGDQLLRSSVPYQRSAKFQRLTWTAGSSAGLKATTISLCFSRTPAIRVQ